MRSLQLVAPRTLEVQEMPDPRAPGAGEVLVRIRAVGICGTDIHFYLEGGCAGSDAPYPTVLGHEPAGEIVEVGTGVEQLKAGMRVAVEPTMTCGHCDACCGGRRNLCAKAVFLGGVQAPGLLREHAVVPAENVVCVPETMSFAAATVVEPLAVLLHSLELAKLQATETVAVMGAGPIGLLAIAVSKLAGASCVVASDRIPHRLAMARKFGAEAVVDFSKESVRDAVLDVTNGKGADVIFDAAGKPESINAALASARPGGRVVIIGIPSERQVALSLWRALHRELTIRVQKRSNGNDQHAVDMLRQNRIDTDSLVSHLFPLDKGGKAFETLAEYADGVVKPVVEL